MRWLKRSYVRMPLWHGARVPDCVGTLALKHLENVARLRFSISRVHEQGPKVSRVPQCWLRQGKMAVARPD